TYRRSPAAGKRHPFCERALGAERVQVASHDARVAPQLALVALELVDLLDDVDGNDDVVVVEAEQRPRIVQQDVGVEDEVLFHRLAGGFPRARPRDAAVGLLAPRFRQYRHGAAAPGPLKRRRPGGGVGPAASGGPVAPASGPRETAGGGRPGRTGTRPASPVEPPPAA